MDLRFFLLFILIGCITSKDLFSQTKDASPVRIAVAGISHGHSNWIFGTKATSQIKIVGIYEADQELVEVFAKRFKVSKDLFHTDLEKMLDRVKPEGVIAFNPTNEHLSVLKACAPRGIHVMVEKPLATTLRDALQMEALAKKHNIHLLVNYETSWYPSIAKMHQLVTDSNFVGGPKKVIMNMGHEGARNIEVHKFFFRWLVDPVKNGGGALPDMGCYGANLMTYLLKGEAPLSVLANTRQFKPEIYPKVDDEATIIINYPSSQCIIQASWNWPFNRKEMEVYGPAGYIITIDDKQMSIRTKKSKSAYTRIVTEKDIPVYDNPLNYFANVIREKNVVPAFGTYSLENNIMVMRILEAARQSAKSGKVIYFKK